MSRIVRLYYYLCLAEAEWGSDCVWVKLFKAAPIMVFEPRDRVELEDPPEACGAFDAVIGRDETVEHAVARLSKSMRFQLMTWADLVGKDRLVWIQFSTYRRYLTPEAGTPIPPETHDDAER